VMGQSLSSSKNFRVVCPMLFLFAYSCAKTRELLKKIMVAIKNLIITDQCLVYKYLTGLHL